jgi:hypothetical protein
MCKASSVKSRQVGSAAIRLRSLRIEKASQIDESVENSFPVFVAREIIVRNKKPDNASRRIGADNRLDMIGSAIP